jgi:hypothetical protein
LASDPKISRTEYVRRLREDILADYREDLEEEGFRLRDPLRGAILLYFPWAVRALVVGLEEVAERYLLCALECVDRALAGLLRPFLGWDPAADRPYWDDAALNYHWALAYCTRYDTTCLLGRSAGTEDLDSGIDHIRKLIASTDGLSGPIRENREAIICSYLWLSGLRKQPSEALGFAETSLGMKGRSTVVKEYHGPRAYVKMLQSVGRYVNGDGTVRESARKSLKNLLAAHQDLVNVSDTVYWPSEQSAFEWAWLWECTFSAQPDTRRAIEILRGTVSLEA